MQHRATPFLAVLLALATTTAARGSTERLLPRDGWNGATVGRVHPGPYADATAVAHWTRLPDQVLWREDPSDFELGVIAYHRSHVDHVRFAVDGGPWVTVSAMDVSPQTGHYEYGVRLVAADFARGWHEVRAVAVPAAGGGTERVLTWRFYDGEGQVAGVDYGERWVDPVAGSDAGAGSAIDPFETVRRAVEDLAASPLGADGAVVYLGDGAGRTIPVGGLTPEVANDVPLTLRPASGSAPRFGPGSGPGPDALRVARLRLEELEVDLSWPDMFGPGPNTGLLPTLYVSGCHFRAWTAPMNASGYASLAPYALTDQVFLEDSVFERADVYLRAGWMRGVTVREVIGTVRARCAIDSSLERSTNPTIAEATFSVHGSENVLADAVRVLGAHVYLSPFGGGAVDGTAVVNCVVDGTTMGDGPGYELCTIFSSQRRHLLILHSTFAGVPMSFDFYQPFQFDLSNGLALGTIADYFNDVSRSGFYNNVLQDSEGMLLDGATVHTAHAKPPWSSWTQGSLGATFVDPAARDFRVRAGSPAWGRIGAADAYQRFDANAELRGDPTAVGALKGENE